MANTDIPVWHARHETQIGHSMAFPSRHTFTPPLDPSSPSYSEAYTVQSNCLVNIFSFVQVFITILIRCGLFISGLNIYPTVCLKKGKMLSQIGITIPVDSNKPHQLRPPKKRVPVGLTPLVIQVPPPRFAPLFSFSILVLCIFHLPVAKHFWIKYLTCANQHIRDQF